MKTVSAGRGLSLGFVVVSAMVGAFFGCSSSDEDPATQVDAGGDAPNGQDGSVPDSGPVTDAGDGGPISCTPTPSEDPAHQFCTIRGACPACANGGAGSVMYSCTSRLPVSAIVDGGLLGQPKSRITEGDAGGSVRLASCTRISLNLALQSAEYCCPAAWVENMPNDVDAGNPFCPPAKPRAYIAPADADGKATLPVPPGCVEVEAMSPVKGSPYAGICCE